MLIDLLPRHLISLSLSFALAATLVFGTLGCTKKTEETKVDPFESDVNRIVQKLEAAKKPYTGKLTPKKVALITHEVSTQSMKAFPVGSEMPKDPKSLQALNEKIRKKNEEIYAKHETTMDEVSQFISSLSPKDREIYNKTLSELFLEQSRKRYDKDKADDAAKEKPDAVPTPVAPEKEEKK